MMERGYFLVDRSIFDNALLKDPAYFRGWLWLVSEAAWAPYRKSVRSGRARILLNLERGQLSHGREFIARALNWTPQRVRTFLNHLEIDGLINRQTIDGQIVISICNYDIYQNAGADANQQTNQQTNQQSTTNQPQLIEYKIQKKDIARSSDFETWYRTYPKKKHPEKAKNAYRKVIASGNITVETLLERTIAFAAEWKQRPRDELKFCPYPASWLNAGGYADEPEVEATSGGPPLKPERDPSTFSDDDWKQPLEHFRSGGKWSVSYWGPAPGKPDCLVPSRLLKPRLIRGAA